MNLSTLKPNSRKSRKRLGRGNASGKGTYCGRGVKGQRSRSGGRRRPGFEGGQTPLIRRMPKLKGFKNPNRIDFQIVNVTALESFENNAVVDTTTLYEKKLIGRKDRPVKILGDGELTKKLEVKVDRVSGAAREKIEKAKGKVAELMKVKEEKKVEKPEEKVETKKEAKKEEPKAEKPKEEVDKSQ